MDGAGLVIDGFAGPGGWDEALRMLGYDGPVVGIEWDPAACATRAAAGHLTIRASVAQLPKERFVGRVAGCIFSPPCPQFSSAGSRLGRLLEDELQQAIRDAFAGKLNLAEHRRTMARKLRSHLLRQPLRLRRDEAAEWAWRSVREASLSVEPARWIAAVRPRWVAMEQVPAVLPLWRVYAEELRALGYSVWCGELNAADFGVPQTRKRAFLIASLDRPAVPPDPTHCRGGASGLFGELLPWVSMAAALGWGTDRAVGFPRLDDTGTSPDGYRERDWRPMDEPAFGLTEKARSWVSVRRGPRPGDDLGANLDEGFDPDAEPSQTVTSKVNRWHVDRPEEEVISPLLSDAPQGALNTGRDWKPGGPRADAQTAPFEEPAPALTAKSGQQWQLCPGRTDTQPNRRNYELDEPAPTVAFGHDAANWFFDRPATTIQGDPRVFTPGGHIANDGRDNSRMKGRSEDAIRLEVPDALVLQSFHPAYPVRGNRTQQFTQVGNAVPPLLAAHVLSGLLGLAAP